MSTAFLEISTGKRRRLVEYVRRGLLARAGVERPFDQPLASPSQIWLERFEAALVDAGCSQKSFDALAVAWEDYLAGLPEEESAELRRRVREFVLVRDAIAGGAA